MTEEQFYADECKPQPIEPSSEHFEGLMNCQECFDTNCPFWKEYNE